MWLVEGPFDGKTSGVSGFSKCKLLKCGRSYILSRKRKQPTNLILNSPKISGEHAVLVVGEHTTQNVLDTNVIPTLAVINKSRKPLHVNRDEARLAVNTDDQFELQHGDTLALASGFAVGIKWQSVSCFLPQNTTTFSFEKCGSLGIKLSATQTAEVTHHLTPMLSVSPSILSSLLRTTHIVHPDWLTEYLRLGDLEKSDHGASEEGSPLTMLEFEFLPPSESKHRPTFASNLPTSLQSFKAWDRNEERYGMFKGWRVLFVGEKGREADQDLLQMLDAGGAEYEVFDVSAGEKKWRQVLGKNQRKASKGLSVVADEETMLVAAEADWKVINDVLKELNLRVVNRSKLLEAVLYLDTSRLDSSLAVNTEEESLSDLIPPANAQPDDPSNPPDLPPTRNVSEDSGAQAGPSRRPLRRRGTANPSRAGSPTPATPAAPESSKTTELQPSTSDQQDVAVAPPPRKPLVRRSRTAAVTNGILDRAIVGVDDPSILDSQPPIIESALQSSMLPPSEPAAESSILDAQSAPASGRPSRLKRRRNADDALINPVLAELQRDIEQVSQIPPPLKKFKALFDETDPDRLESQGGAILSNIDFDEDAMGPTQTNVPVTNSGSQTQTQTQNETMASRTARKPPRRLAAVAEEVEESQLNSVPPATAPAVTTSADVEMDGSPVEEPPPNQAANVARSAKPISSSTNHTLGNFNSTQQPPLSRSSKAATGAAPGKPDTDAVFLKAIASTKKGKKGEDDFDREFNNLRISKPEVQKDEQAKEWELLADFGDDGDLRGNFMVIVEMDVPERPRRDASVSDNPRWQGKPNFKRFKKKHVERFKNPVELVVDDDNDYGMGAAYWKTGSQSQSQSQSQGDGLSYLQPSQTQNKVSGSSSKPASKSKGKAPARATQPRRGRSRSVLEVGSGSEEDEAPKRAGRGTQARSKAAKSQPLFLPDEDEDPTPTLDEEPSGEMFDLDVGDMLLDEDEDDVPPTKTKGRGGKAAQESVGTSKRKRTAALIDDDTAFKGFGARKRTRT